MLYSRLCLGCFGYYLAPSIEVDIERVAGTKIELECPECGSKEYFTVDEEDSEGTVYPEHREE